MIPVIKSTISPPRLFPLSFHSSSFYLVCMSLYDHLFQRIFQPDPFLWFVGYISTGSQGKEPVSGLITLLFNYPLLYNELHSPKSKYYKTQGDRVKVERLFQNHIIFHVLGGYFTIFHPGFETKPPFHRNSVLNFFGFHITFTFFIFHDIGSY